MAKVAVVLTGGKQFIVKANDEILVQKIEGKENDKIQLAAVATFDDEKEALELGAPTLSGTVEAIVLGQEKGHKVRISKFKSKVRYRKTRGFREQLTKLRIVTV